MDISLIGNQIQKFRKERNLTQRELGAAIGVSTQAVSQWETGGAPDVALLPAIADKLNVTVDALFGREGGEVRDIFADTVAWLRSKPEETRMQVMTQLIWNLSLYALHPMDMPELGYLKNCEYDMGNGNLQLMKSLLSTEGGLVLGVAAEDMAFMSVFPEPEEGYERFFLGNDKYREFFAALAAPGTLEVMRYLAGQEEGFFTISAAAKRVGLPPEEAEGILEKLTELGALHKLPLNVENGVTYAYAMPNQEFIVPLLYFARWAMDAAGAYFTNLTRRRPCLAPKGEWKNEKK